MRNEDGEEIVLAEPLLGNLTFQVIDELSDEEGEARVEAGLVLAKWEDSAAQEIEWSFRASSISEAEMLGALIQLRRALIRANSW